jgi:hypothetical protein
MGTGRSYHEVYESGGRIPADEITEWTTDAAEYIPRLFQADPVQFAPMARFLRAALLIVEQLQSDAAQARAAGAAEERERWVDELQGVIDTETVPIQYDDDEASDFVWASALKDLLTKLDGAGSGS